MVDDASPDLGLAAEVIPPLRTLRTAVVRQAQLERAREIDNPALKDYLARAETLTTLEVAKAEWGRSKIWDEARRFFERYDLLLLPTTQVPPFPKEQAGPLTVGGKPAGPMTVTSLATYAITMTSLPAISVPCGFTADGLPLGLQIVGGWRREADVLRAAAAFEEAFPWTHHRAPVVREAAGV